MYFFFYEIKKIKINLYYERDIFVNVIFFLWYIVLNIVYLCYGFWYFFKRIVLFFKNMGILVKILVKKLKFGVIFCE